MRYAGRSSKLFKFSKWLLTLAVSIAVFVPSFSFAATGMTYHGRILKPNGRPLEAAAVFFHIQVRSPGSENCLLYDEQQTLNMTGSGGIFVLTIGEGTRVGPGVDGGYSLDKIFANRGTLTLPNCNVGSTYSPAIADGRKLQVQFNDGTTWETLPPQNINYVPLAIEATQVSGYKKDQLLRVADGVVATEFTNANWTALWDLITGNSSVYSKADGSNFNPTADVSFNNKHAINLADPVASSDAATKGYVDGRVGGKTGDFSGVSAVTGNGYTIVWDQAQQKWVTGVPNDTSKLPLAGGTMTGAINMGAQSITNVGHVQIAAQGTLYLGKFTTAEQANLLATGHFPGATALDATDAGRTWFNTTTGKMMYWNGTSADVVGSKAYIDNLVSTATSALVQSVSGTAGQINSTGGVNPVLSLIDTGVTAGSYGGASNIPQFSVDSKGRITNVSNVVVDDTSKVKKSGDTMSGLLILSGDPSNAVGAATKQYVDSAVSTAGGAFLKKDGTVALTNDWDIDGAAGSGFKITGLKDPTALDGAATKNYVDTQVSGAVSGLGDITDVTAGTGLSGGGSSGNVTLNLANTTVVAGSYGTTTKVPRFQVDAQGRLLTVAEQNIDVAGALGYTPADATKFITKNLPAAPGAGQTNQSIRYNGTAWEYFSPAAGTVNSVSGVAGETVAGGTAADPTIGLANSGVTAGSYGTTIKVPRFQVDAKGRIVSVSEQSIDVATALGYTPVQSVSAGTGINMTGTATAPIVNLANTAVSAGSYGTSSKVARFQVDAQGRLVAAQEVSIDVPGALGYTPVQSVSNVAGETSLGGTAQNPTIGLPNTTVVAGSYGSASKTLQVAVDAKGRLTSASEVNIAIAPVQITQASANSGEVLKWNGSAWAPAADTDTDVAGNTTFITKALPAAPGAGQTNQSIRYNGTAWEYFSPAAGTVNSVSGVAGETVAGGTAADPTIGLANSGVTAGSYGTTIKVPRFQVDAKGRIVTVSEQNIDVVTALGYTPLSAVTNVASLASTKVWVGDAGGKAQEVSLGGDIASVANNGSVALATTGVSAGSYGSATQVPQFAVDSKGRLTSAGNINIALPVSQLTQSAANSGEVLKWNGSAWAPAADNNAGGDITDVVAGTGLSGGGSSGSVTVNLANTTVTAGSYGTTTKVPRFQVDAQGRLLTVAEQNIDVPGALGYTPVKSVSGTASQISNTGTAQDPVLALVDTAIVAGSYGTTTKIPRIQFDSKGRAVTAVEQTVDVAGALGYTPADATKFITKNLPAAPGAGQTNQSIRYNGTAWEYFSPAAGTVNSVSAGTGMTATGTAADPVLNLANTAVSAGSYGTSSKVARFQVDAQGRLVSAQEVSIAIAPAQINQAAANSGEVLKWNGSAWAPAADAGLTSETDPTVAAFAKNAPAAMFTTPSGVLTLADTAVSAGSYGTSSKVARFQVDAQGRLVAAQEISIAIPASQITQTGANSGEVLKWNGSAWAPAADTDTDVAGNTTFITKALPAAPGAGQTNQSIRYNGTAWEYFSPAAGTVNSVSGTAGEISNTGTATDPVMALVATGVSAGSYGTTIKVPRIQVDAKGRIVTVSEQNISVTGALGLGAPGSGNAIRYNGTAWEYFTPSTGTVTSVSNVAGETSLGGTASAPTIGLATISGLTAGSYGTSSKVARFQIDSKGRVIATQEITIDDTTKLPLAGGTMTGAINMNSHLINNVTDPSGAQDAATKNYVDTRKLSNLAATTSAELASVISDETGTAGKVVFSTSPTITTPNLVGFNLNGATSGGVAFQVAATGAAGTYTWPSAVPAGNRILQTDSSGNLTWITAGGGGDAFVANPLSQFAATTSAQLAGVLSDETGSGLAVFGTSPSLTTPTITSGSLKGFTLSGATSGGASFTIAATGATGSYTWPSAAPASNKVLQSDSSGNLTWVTGGDALTTGKLSQFAATTSAELAGVISDETGSGLLVYGTAPTLKSFTLGGATSGGITMQVAATGAAGTYTWPSATPASNMVLQSDNTGALSWVTAATGSVTGVSVVSANGLAGTVATSSTTPAITLSTSVTGMVKGNGTAFSAATAGTDYSAGTSGLATGILKSTTTTGALSIAGSTDITSALGYTPVNKVGDTMSGMLAITVATATNNAAVLKSSDNSNTKNIFEVQNSSGTATVTLRPDGVPTASTDLTTKSYVTGLNLGNFSSTTSAQLAGVLSDETGTAGNVVFSGSPTITTPTIKGMTLGGATSGGITMQVAATGAAGTYTWPSATPSANKFLQSDSSGNLSWQSAGAGDALTTNTLAQFAATTSAQLAGVLNDETGSGLAVFGTSPVLTTPSVKGFTLSGATSGGASFTIAATGATGSYTWPSAAPASNKVLQSDSSGNLSWVTGGDALTTGKLSQFAATTSAELAGVISDETGSGLLVYGTAPTLKSFTIGGSTSGGITMQVAATGAAGTYTWPSATPSANAILQSSNTGALSWVTSFPSSFVDWANPGTIGSTTPNTGAFTTLTAGSGNTNFSHTGTGTFGTGTGAVSLNGDVTIAANKNLSMASGTGVFSQTFTGTTTTASAITANSLTTGTILSATTSNASVNSTNGLLYVANTSAGTSGTVARIASNSTAGSGLTVLASGNVGVGTASPGTALEVKAAAGAPAISMAGSTSGAVKFQVPAAAGTQTYTWPSATPASSMVLQSDNTGALSWVTAATGSVTGVSVVSANGFAGTVATSSTTPAITLTTSVTGMLKGNGTAISAATAGTDYSAGTSGLATGILKSTTTTGALSIAGSTDITSALGYTPVNKVGDTMSGMLAITVATATNNAAVLKSSDNSNTKNIFEVQNSSGTPTVTLRPDGVPTASTDLTTKSYVTGLNLGNFSSTTSAQLAGVLSDETGTAGNVVFSGSPTITTPTIKGMTLGGATSGGITMQVAATGAAGTYTWPSATPSANAILQSSNTGALSWVTSFPSSFVDWANPGTIGSTTPNTGAFTTLTAGSGNTNFSHTGTGTFGTGTGAVSLNGDVTIAANKNLSMASGTGVFSQTFTGTTTTASAITANSLTTGSMLSLTTSNASVNSTNGLLYVANTSAGTSGTIARVQSNSTAGSGLTVNANGKVGVGLTAPVASFHVRGDDGSGRALFASKDGTQAGVALGSSGLNYGLIEALKADMSGSENLVINAGGGSVAIGKTSAAARLDVKGGIAISGTTTGSIIFNAPTTVNSGTYTWPAATPASNMVLQSDNTGALSWVAQSASVAADSLDFSDFKEALTLDASTDIAASGTNVLSITNTGTGNSFVVNDQASDTTPFIIDASGNIGIGTTAPTSVDANSSLFMTLDGGSSHAEISVGRSQTALGTLVGGYNFFNTYGAGAEKRIAAIWSGTETATSSGNLQFYVATAGTLAEKMRLDNSGNLMIGKSSSPNGLLDVKGALAISGSTSGAIKFNAPSTVTSGNYTWPSATPSANAFLQSDNTGALTWQTTIPSGSVNWAAPGTIGSTTPNTGAFTTLTAGSGNTNFSHTGTGTFGTGTGAVSLNGDVTIAANKNLSMASGTGVFSQTFTGTTTTASAITANSLTTGSILSATTSNATVNSTNGLLYVANTSAGTSGTVARIQSNSTAGSGLTVLANGNVGIGTTAPQDRFHVAMTASDSLVWGMTIQNPNNSPTANAGVGIKFKTSDYSANSETYKWAGITSVIDSGTTWGDYTGLAFYTHNGNTGNPPAEVMRIRGNGNVGIGTTNPGQTLEVYGTGMYVRDYNSTLRFTTDGATWIESGTTTSTGSTADINFTGMNGTPYFMKIAATGNVGIGTGAAAPTSTLTVNGSLARNYVTVTGTTYTVAATDTHIKANVAGTLTLTLPAAASFPGREISIRTITANTVISASSNVVPLAGGAAGTAILSATAGKWAMLVSDGTNWQIQMGN